MVAESETRVLLAKAPVYFTETTVYFTETSVFLGETSVRELETPVFFGETTVAVNATAVLDVAGEGFRTDRGPSGRGRGARVSVLARTEKPVERSPH